LLYSGELVSILGVETIYAVVLGCSQHGGFFLARRRVAPVSKVTRVSLNLVEPEIQTPLDGRAAILGNGVEAVVAREGVRGIAPQLLDRGDRFSEDVCRSGKRNIKVRRAR
jgi:hypothetical protein